METRPETKDGLQMGLVHNLMKGGGFRLSNAYLSKLSNSSAGVLMIYFSAMLIHLSTMEFSNIIGINLISFCAGLIWSIILPGISLVTIIFPSRRVSIWISIVGGLLLEICAIHLAFLSGLYLGLIVNPIVFMILVSSIFVSLLVWKFKASDPLDCFILDTSVWKNRYMLGLIIIAVGVRILLTVIGIDSIAPDACMYSNYAENLLNGEFYTNVVNDNRIYTLWDGFQYSFHQSFVYLAALSFILVKPAMSGPIPIILLSGFVLTGLVYDITKEVFGSKAALVSSSILLIHPTIAFYSTFAYGPEITSLVFIMGSLLILVKTDIHNKRSYAFAGILFGMADLIWYPNFLLFGAALPFFLLYIKKLSKREFFPILFITYAMLGIRIFVLYLDVFYIGLSIILAISAIFWVKEKESQVKGFGFFCILISVFEIVWRGPIQFSSTGSMLLLRGLKLGSLAQAQNPELIIFFSEITPILIGKFTFFLLAQLGPVVLFTAVMGVVMKAERKKLIAFLSILLIGSIGTLFLFASFSKFKEVLLLEYFYSDSRFFLSFVAIGTIAASYVISSFLEPGSHSFNLKSIGIRTVDNRKIMSYLILILAFSYAPTFALIPSGIEMINIESRYGWVNLGEGVLNLTEPSDIILTVRATEMAWQTGLYSAYPTFTKYSSLPIALKRLASLFRAYNAAYFIMDGYTSAKYGILDEILHTPLELAGVIPVDIQKLDSVANHIEMDSIVLVLQTPKNSIGDYARVFSLDSSNYSKVDEINLQSIGWAVGNGGVMINQSGIPELIIGTDASYSYTWRPLGYDLYLATKSGFIVVEVEELTASVERIEVFDSNGDFMCFASKIKDGLFFILSGDASIGDIRIVIEGEPGDSILIKSIDVWNSDSI